MLTTVEKVIFLKQVSFFKEMYASIMVCSSDPCQNGGTCHELSYGRFRCDCADGILGSTCEGNVKIDT